MRPVATGTLDSRLKLLAQKMTASGQSLVTVESCTGGMIASAITDIPGSSQWYWGGFITYANEAKIQLGVALEEIEQHGAVSEQVARSMAQQAATRAGIETAISVTGIAGPDGGTRDKPVGTVCFGWYIRGTLSSETCSFDGDRKTIRTHARDYSLSGLLARV